MQASIEQEIKALQEALCMDLECAHTLATLIARGTSGREVSLCITSLQQAHSWLDWGLKELAREQEAHGR